MRKLAFGCRPGGACGHTVGMDVVLEDPVRAEQSRLKGRFANFSTLAFVNLLRSKDHSWSLGKNYLISTIAKG